ncbi:DASH complex subunit Dad1-domain-containing protein [Aspergillus karnatakaensis]|uniref:DASH complex subunit DAD1 n=1 Tax=Aspergillus karnatakaensis TaxID=1810916 RepID=UPI003CCD04D8
MRDMPSKFVEILDFKDSHPRISDSDVLLEDVLASHEALVARPSSTQNSNSSKVSLDRDRGKMTLSTPAPKRSASPTVFEQQREELVREIAMGMEQVLQNINRLNRNLESIIAVGNEFGSVEALWSQFENFMGRPQEEVEEGQGQAHGQTKQEHEEGDSEMQ